MRHTAHTLALLAALAAASLPATGHSQDTIVGRCDRYHYTDWYDECESYQDNSWPARMMDRVGNLSNTGSQVIVSGQLATGSLTVKGLVAFVSARPDTVVNVTGETGPSRLPEYLILAQGHHSPAMPPTRFYPGSMTVLDSVRWDTAAPRTVLFPLSPTDSEPEFSCLAYEAYFPEPITVDSLFYIIGTLHNNVIIEDSTIGSVPHYKHMPSVYTCLMQFNMETCYICPPRCHSYTCPSLLIDDTTMRWHPIDYIMRLSGLFLPIVELPTAEPEPDTPPTAAATKED